MSSERSLNPKLGQLDRRRKKKPTLAAYIKGIQSGNRVVLSQAITLVESQKQEHQVLAQQIIEACLPKASAPIRIGITGAPGVGKSTFIEALGKHITNKGKKLAVLAIDPSSQISKGSIMGDKTRMAELSSNPLAFIRPSPAGNALGGVAQKTRETMILCEAAGYDTIIVETVGVGQSEISVHSMVDFFLLLLLPGAGDELQGIKRGIVEMADLIAVNKADGDRMRLAKTTRRAYKNAIHLFPPKENNWTPSVETCSALEGKSIDTIWEVIENFKIFTTANQSFDKKRQAQAKFWLQESINEQLRNLFSKHPAVQEALVEIEKAVLEGKKTPFQGAAMLLALFQQKS